MDWKEFDKWIGALCCWREARGEGRDGQRAVLHVINNRAVAANKSWAQIVYARLQFSSMTYPQDPQLTNVPVQPDAQFVACYLIADSIMAGTDPDLTGGATHYYAANISMPEWAKSMTETARIGNQNFYR